MNIQPTRRPVSSCKYFMHSNRGNRQRGVGMLEVLIAMLVLAIGALAVVNLQTASTTAISISADHFKINELSQTIVEQLKLDRVRAAAGEYDTEFEDAGAPATAIPEIAQNINSWKLSMARALPDGETSVQCTASECTVGLRWYETSFGGVSTQVFNVKTPLQ